MFWILFFDVRKIKNYFDAIDFAYSCVYNKRKYKFPLYAWKKKLCTGKVERQTCTT